MKESTREQRAYFWGLSHPPSGGCDSPLSIRVVVQVIGLEKEGDLNGEGFNRGTRRDGPLRGSGASQEHPASPEHHSGSVPFKRCQGEIPYRSRELFRGGFCCLSGTDCHAPSDVTRRVEGGFVDGTVRKQQLDRVLRECVYRRGYRMV